MVTDNADHLIQADLEVIVEATGVTEAGTYHALTALEAGKHVVMANVETDALLGPILKKKADEKGLIYSMAYGDQPGIICEMVDWARTIVWKWFVPEKERATSRNAVIQLQTRSGTTSVSRGAGFVRSL